MGECPLDNSVLTMLRGIVPSWEGKYKCGVEAHLRVEAAPLTSPVASWLPTRARDVTAFCSGARVVSLNPADFA